MRRVRIILVAVGLAITTLPMIRPHSDLPLAYATGPDGCTNPGRVNGQRTLFNPPGNPAGVLYGDLQTCGSTTNAVGEVDNSYTSVEVQTCDYTNAGSNCSGWTYELASGGVVYSPGNKWSPGSSWDDGTIDWYNGSDYEQTPGFY